MVPSMRISSSNNLERFLSISNKICISIKQRTMCGHHPNFQNPTSQFRLRSLKPDNIKWVWSTNIIVPSYSKPNQKTKNAQHRLLAKREIRTIRRIQAVGNLSGSAMCFNLGLLAFGSLAWTWGYSNQDYRTVLQLSRPQWNSCWCLL